MLAADEGKLFAFAEVDENEACDDGQHEGHGEQATQVAVHGIGLADSPEHREERQRAPHTDVVGHHEVVVLPAHELVTAHRGADAQGKPPGVISSPSA
ncbi:hypothetical protein EON65_54635 [archaeon]|nr:MAG: hypothetical protein EON65_54635 [archaeon]